MDVGGLLSTLNFDGKRDDGLLSTLLILAIIFLFGKDRDFFGFGDDCCCKKRKHHHHHKHCCCDGKRDDGFFILLLIALVLLLSRTDKDKCD